MTDTATVHASAVLIGARAVLIRGPSGSGKSRLALSLLDPTQSRLLPFARLVGDDRVHLDVHHGRVLVRPHPSLAGLIEVWGVGIRRVPHEPVALVGLVVDLCDEAAERMPEEGAPETEISGIRLPRLAVARGSDPLAPLLAVLATTPAAR